MARSSDLVLNAFRRAQSSLPSSALEEARTGTQGRDSDSSGKISKTVGTVLTAGLLPAVSALKRLIGDRVEQPAPLLKYVLPPSVSLEAGSVSRADGSFGGIDYGQDGKPRLIQSSERRENTGPSAQRARNPIERPAESTNITIQVQAMDSRSFSDHSHDIARAVREAMLNMNPLNDVVNDL